ncbi:unnamed protein product [Gongylonema pulchrum]|uniref:PK_Tyr_Ser-Thr domain-containing protein n=1 Tax=Gongylonema pulchrum TaxID=637853 RepID=A0A183D0H5_9BILA|nr:unnamed protein product [Gongylonema pulchrum]
MNMPEAPEGIPALIEHCWEQDPLNRWSMAEAVNYLEQIVKKPSQLVSAPTPSPTPSPAPMPPTVSPPVPMPPVPLTPKSHRRSSKARTRSPPKSHSPAAAAVFALDLAKCGNEVAVKGHRSPLRQLYVTGKLDCFCDLCCNKHFGIRASALADSILEQQRAKRGSKRERIA